MINKLIESSLQNKLIVLLATATMAGFGLFALLNIPIGAVPDVTNNQVQVITTSRNLSTLDVERFLTYPVELEMANLPGLVEIRSVSKFGLSVVTIVFEDNIGTYLPRQLIAERLQTALENIPQGFGTPFMGPISTGLGEIYQYVLEVDPAYKDRYSTTDLRTIQDWMVRRQLSGIPGVVEVNTWGGYLKQYEVAIDPNRLKAMDVTIEEVFTALERNNSIAGGGYIEKSNQSFFIRSEGLIGSEAELQQLVVKRSKGQIVKISDIASVHIGSATRFGAITANGEGEKVLGQVMMLKGANSSKVINDVKKRVEEISSSLPPGIRINGFLERSALIRKTTFTIAENLILGCLIVIFVVVLLLGNLRSGLVIASVIPLSLLFALSLMYLFGVDANLMSLGAIDFGIIIDGAVIIVEYIAFQITRNRSEILKLENVERQALTDKITLKGARKLTRSAIFGQLIIIIVFIPILSLTGIEGKMFRPMAQVFTFALIGTMILGFTYVPVVSSMFLRPASGKVTFSDRLLLLLNRAYEPSVSWALRHRITVIIVALMLLAWSVFIFSGMGGEFVPTLDEGDFVIQPVFKSGTSLSETIALTTRIETILKGFPEVDQVVSRIGAAEVPTDPMSMEESDIIITLRPPKEWVTAKSKDALADKFKEALLVIPGIDYEFTQPIEMRFNELITGTRADVAIKVFGEDLEVLNKLALRIKTAIEGVEGASDIIVEKTAGLPEMTISYDRTRLALYGLCVEDVNRVISMGFAGMKSGEIFEGERRFDLVIRYEKDFRSDIEHLRKAMIPLPDGSQIPVSEVAQVNLTKGPAKISRDNTHRRVVVGVNVRNRDLESVVSDIRNLIDEKVRLPEGYSIAYGGQFENLRSARKRLMIAVPIALILIFTLLHLAFGSFREALMVYSAIPLSAVGGVLLLWMRGMPFSISAGVGFIALFGIAVLNGIVLIEHFKELKKHGVDDLRERILRGTRERLRPVLLTASAAAMGFMPMAISTSAGAEVQRPLATVVVGGLISATLLTMIVLPVMYCLFETESKIRKRKRLPAIVKISLLLLLMSGAKPLLAQELNRTTAIETALQNSPRLKAAAIEVMQSEVSVRTAFDPDKTIVYYNFDQNNIAENGQPLKVWGIQQQFSFPAYYVARNKLLEELHQTVLLSYNSMKLQLIKEVELTWEEVAYHWTLKKSLTTLDSSLQLFAEASRKSFESGASNQLDYLAAASKAQSVHLRVQDTEKAFRTAAHHLQMLLNKEVVLPVNFDYYPLWDDSLRIGDSLALEIYFSNSRTAVKQHKVAKYQAWPDLNFEYFLGANNVADSKRYNGFQLGLAIPIWFPSKYAAVKAARLQSEVTLILSESNKQRHGDAMFGKNLTLQAAKEKLAFYQQTGIPQNNALRAAALRSYETGEINVLQYLLLLDQVLNTENDYLNAIHQYNLQLIDIKYFIFE
mgnify:FL=1